MPFYLLSFPLFLFLCCLLCQLLDEASALDEDAELFAAAVAAADFPELAAARAHLARLRLRVRQRARHTKGVLSFKLLSIFQK